MYQTKQRDHLSIYEAGAKDEKNTRSGVRRLRQLQSAAINMLRRNE